MRKNRQLISIYLGTALAGMVGGGIGGFALGAPSTLLAGMVGGGLGGLFAAHFFSPRARIIDPFSEKSSFLKP
jgi:uncharacterized membrane protein YgaE (UPF0421/DUF939 family)